MGIRLDPISPVQACPGLSGAMGPTEEIHKGIVENALEPRIRLHDSTGQHNHQMSTTR